MLIRLRDRRDFPLDVCAAAERILSGVHYVPYYDALPSGDPHQLSVLDLALPAYLGAVPNFRRLLDRGRREGLQLALRTASDALQCVPLEVRLADWEPSDSHRELLCRLFRATTGAGNGSIPGFGPACCTKMLHKKRPELIPIIDSWQLEAWGSRARSWNTNDMADVVFRIRDRVAAHDTELMELAGILKSEDPSLPALSAIRLYDILFWELSFEMRDDTY